MAKNIDITGQTFERLTAIEYLGGGKWRCKCSCGNDVITTYTKLRSGVKKSCGCLKAERKIDISGKRYGQLVAVKRIIWGKWLFKCDCGNECVKSAGNITNGRIKTCGDPNNHPKYKDIAGRRFGRLVAIKHLGCGKWLFRCDCGNEHISTTNNVEHGMVKSCGCLNIEMCNRPRLDLEGKRFGHLLVKRFDNESGKWECLCDCGQTVYRLAYALRLPKVASCGCFCRNGENIKHGKTHTAEHRIWLGMKQRCYNSKSLYFSNYGGRGIEICDRWLGKHGFEHFIEDMGFRPTSKHTIDRINVNGNYEPSNCRWVTRLEQSNNLRKTIYVTYQGETKSIRTWARDLGLNVGTVCSRFHKGLPIEKVFSKELLK